MKQITTQWACIEQEEEGGEGENKRKKKKNNRFVVNLVGKKNIR